MTVLETPRLALRQLSPEDAPFILQLVNDPSWLRFIGDRGIRTLEAARDYIAHGPMQMYARLGFGLWLVQRRQDDVPIGLCGLIKRDALEHVDLGFALLPQYRGYGYAHECAAATLSYGASACGLSKVLAIVSPGNERSDRLLEKLGFVFEHMIRLSAGDPEIKLYARTCV
jgi:ribosomal-protein-alanine N-acetyltransferase